MSKTKEEIIRAMGLSDPDGEIEDVMDIWAEQRLHEYKEQLKAKLKASKIANPITDIGFSHNSTLDTIIIHGL